MFGNTGYGSWIISTTNSLCVINGNLVLQTVCVSYISNQQQLCMSAELVCAETQPHLHVQRVLKLYEVKENCNGFSRYKIS